jgi:hypothetical protein
MHDRILPDFCVHAQALWKQNILDTRNRYRRDRQNHRHSLSEGDHSSNTGFPREAFLRKFYCFVLSLDRKNLFPCQEFGIRENTIRKECRLLHGVAPPEGHTPFDYAGEPF